MTEFGEIIKSVAAIDTTGNVAVVSAATIANRSGLTDCLSKNCLTLRAEVRFNTCFFNVDLIKRFLEILLFTRRLMVIP